MAGIEKPKEKVLGKATTNPPLKTKVDVTVKSLTISVYFDGTGNNRFNIEANRKSDPFKRQPDRLRQSVSYNNYYSNVAMLFFAQETKNGIHENIYIEGAGTFKYKEDQTMPGLAFGSGGSGIVKRVNQAVNQVIKKMEDNRATRGRLNVYGFSRGAAYARYFCHKIKQAEKHLGMRFTINFVGLFDTVSSVGLEHYNDVKEFKLDVGAVEGIRRIVHFTAQNEYRYHFPLTPIKGAVKDGRGFECSFPGAHSDVGGGYHEPWHDLAFPLSHNSKTLLGAGKIFYQWYIDKGYFTPQQVSPDRLMLHYMIGNRKNITLDYQFVTAAIMLALMKREAAFEEKKQSALKDNIQRMKAIPVLKTFHSQAEKYVLENYQKNGLNFRVPLVRADEMKQIYNRHLHISWNPLETSKLSANVVADEATKVNGKINPMQPTRPTVEEGFRK